MKTVLGLDLGTTSIGWALVKEGENADIIKTGVRVIPLTSDEITNFEKGRSITTNADRTLKRSMRRNLQRYKLRREELITILKSNKLISDTSILCENSPGSTFETYRIRSKAATEKITMDEFARVLLMINKKRGYKSSRKAKNEEEGHAVDGMEVARTLYERDITPGQYSFERLISGKGALPDYYRSDLNAEFEKIWNFQSSFYPAQLTRERMEYLLGKTRMQTVAIFSKEYKIDPAELIGKLPEKKLKRAELRSRAVSNKLELGELVEVFADINGNLANSSGYLGAISDRSKELFFGGLTVGQYLWKQLKENPNNRIKGQTFYRQDYLDEFEKLWEKQSEYHPQLTEELKKTIRDIVIFYQRKLKSQKGLLSVCELEGKKKEVIIDGKKKEKVIGPKVIPKSSPLFQDFKIWSQLNNVRVVDKDSGKERERLSVEQMFSLYNELRLVDRMSVREANKILGTKSDFNFKELEGNRTMAALIGSYVSIAQASGHEIELSGLGAEEKIGTLTAIYETLGINTSILSYSTNLAGDELIEQPLFKLWHLLYSYEGDNSKSGTDSLIATLSERYGMEKEYAVILANTSLSDDYGSLSSKAIRNILPYLREGNGYDEAAALAGYNHSGSLTTEEKNKKQLRDSLEIFPKNSLRNPVVEKILNQMIHVVNGVISEYGKPDAIRIELARELKKSADERDKLSKSISASEKEHQEIRKKLEAEFGLKNVSRNDIIRYKLYEELKDNGYKTLYSNTYIAPGMLFTGEVDIEHIIPQAKLFDDSFSNKTLELRQVNIKKGNATALDFVSTEYGPEAAAQYMERIKLLFNREGKRTKLRKLLWTESDIPSDFLNRDLQDTRYISKKAKELLEEIVFEVGTTTGSVTDKLREDWQLVDIMKELNLPRYEALGMTEEITGKNGKKVKVIKDWTKRNDHRHHVMDAITVAFTKPSYIQYLNNLNARSEKNGVIYAIAQKEMYFDGDNKRRFNPPMPLDRFRALAKEHLENTLVSFKSKNKVTTQNKNTISKGSGKSTQVVATPRGQLHNESIYGSSFRYETKIEKIGASFDREKIGMVADKKYREALFQRLQEHDGDPKKAFTGKNALDKAPIYLDHLHTKSVPPAVKLVWKERIFTIRKPVDPNLKIDKVIDEGARRVLQERLDAFGGDAKKAFTGLEEHPIYLNKEKGITLKAVTITGVSNAVALHTKKDHMGKELLDENGSPQPADFVSPSNNHHVAVYIDEKGDFQEEVVSLMEAVIRKNEGMDVIKYNHEKGWALLFTMKQNEYFIFPDDNVGFYPEEINLFDPKLKHLISRNLFRVQKLSSRDYFFRHHLETNVETPKETKDVTWKRVSLSALKGVQKVRINALGDIVEIIQGK